jgi:hypothetical protein
MQPVYAWTAVVRGAVLRGLEGNMVISRKARMHYGTSYATVYDEEKHSVSERYWSPLWERWMVSDRMQWHIAKVSLVSFSNSGSYRGNAENAETEIEREISNLGACVNLGRGDLATQPDRVPLHAQLPARPVANGDGRPDRMRSGRAPRRVHSRPRARLHSHDGPQRRAEEPVHASHYDEGCRV